MKIILASNSPRRRRLLENIGLDFKVIPSNFDENSVAYSTPSEYVTTLARKKVEEVAKTVSDSLIIGADTIVVYGKEVIGKPEDPKEARDILFKLSGKSHYVYTGLCLLDQTKRLMIIDKEVTEVKFKDLKKDTINTYLQKGQALDKAGGYNAEDCSEKVFIDYVKGSRTNVVGLPVEKLVKMLDNLGIEVEDYGM